MGSFGVQIPHTPFKVYNPDGLFQSCLHLIPLCQEVKTKSKCENSVFTGVTAQDLTDEILKRYIPLLIKESYGKEK